MSTRNWSAVIAEVDALAAQQGLTKKEACRRLGVTPGSYYRNRKRRAAAAHPALDKDWLDLALEFECFVAPLPQTAQLHQSISTGANAERKPGPRTEAGRRAEMSRIAAKQEQKARAFRRDLAVALEETFGKPAGPSGTAIRGQLHSIAKAIANLSHATTGLDDQAWGYLSELEGQRYRVRGCVTIEAVQRSALINHTFHIREALDLVAPFGPRVQAFASAFSSHLEETGESGGGHSVDPRVLRLIVRLAYLFAKYAGKPPTFTRAPATGEPTSDFFTFVEDVFQYFLAEIDVTKNALEEGCRHVAAGTDWGCEVQGC